MWSNTVMKNLFSAAWETPCGLKSVSWSGYVIITLKFRFLFADKLLQAQFQPNICQHIKVSEINLPIAG